MSKKTITLREMLHLMKSRFYGSEPLQRWCMFHAKKHAQMSNARGIAPLFSVSALPTWSLF